MIIIFVISQTEFASAFPLQTGKIFASIVAFVEDFNFSFLFSEKVIETKIDLPTAFHFIHFNAPPLLSFFSSALSADVVEDKFK